MENNYLHGCNVVVTRPEAQAHGLATLIEAAGGNAILFPVLKITDTEDKSALDQLITELSDYAILIFISPNAVKFGLGYILQQQQIPESCKIATVGKGSATCAKNLLQRDIDIVPSAFNNQSGGYNSETLLSLAELHSVKNKKIAILRGNGGRNLLADTLRERGALVSYINTYTRNIPDDDRLEKRLNTLIKYSKVKQALCVTITSGESLHNFVTLLANRAPEWLNKTQLIVINERLVAIAKQLRFEKEPLIAKNASDQALMDCVYQWCVNNKAV